MAEKNEEYTFGPQPYQFGQEEVSTAPPAPPAPEEPTGVENIGYDNATMQGAPDNPKNAREVVERGVVNVANPQKSEPPAVSTDVEQVITAVSPEQQERNDAVVGSDRQIKTIQDWMEAEENRPETEEQRKKRERREKSKKIIAAVSDGISALSNLYFTSQYAPNMYNHEKGSMTNAVDARIERMKAEREKKRDQYLNFALKLGDIENDRAKTLRELEAQQERQKLAREKAQREAEQHNWLAALQPDKQREQAGKANKAEQDAITAQAEAENAPALQAAKLDTEKARAGAQRASAANSHASASAHNRSNVSEFSAWDEHGKEHKFRTKEAAEAYAKQHGTWKEEDETETTTTETRRNPNAQPQTRTATKTKTKKGGHAGKPSPTGSRQSPTA